MPAYPRPEPINPVQIRWKVTKENLYILDETNFKNLSRNMQDILRYVRQMGELVGRYEAERVSNDTR